MQMSCCSSKRAELQELLLAAPITSHIHALKCQKPFAFYVQTKVDKDGETQEVTICRMQLDNSEWLVDEFMSLMCLLVIE